MFFWLHYHWFGKALFGQSGHLFAFWPGILGAWLDYCRGMAFIGPIHLLCFILLFVYAFSKRKLSGFVLLALYVSSFVIDTSSWHWVDPFNHPGRRLVEIIPLTCVPLGYFLKRKKDLSFYWLAAFLSLLSISYMLLFVLNPSGIDRPVRYLTLSHQQFRTFCSNLPAFGKSFHNFPWTHAGTATASLILFILFWLDGERKSEKKFHIPVCGDVDNSTLGVCQRWMDEDAFRHPNRGSMEYEYELCG
jgi:hypothetical protein